MYGANQFFLARGNKSSFLSATFPSLSFQSYVRVESFSYFHCFQEIGSIVCNVLDRGKERFEDDEIKHAFPLEIYH